MQLLHLQKTAEQVATTLPIWFVHGSVYVVMVQSMCTQQPRESVCVNAVMEKVLQSHNS